MIINFLARVPLSQAGRQWGIWSGVRERREELNLVSLDLIQRLYIFSAYPIERHRWGLRGAGL